MTSVTKGHLHDVGERRLVQLWRRLGRAFPYGSATQASASSDEEAGPARGERAPSGERGRDAYEADPTTRKFAVSPLGQHWLGGEGGTHLRCLLHPRTDWVAASPQARPL